MRHANRLIALLLTLVLAFGVTLPALAEGKSEAEADPAMPVITVQPQGVTVRGKKSATLSVQAHIPNGDEIGYRWYRFPNEIVGETSELQFDGTKNGTYRYYVDVYNRSNPAYCVSSTTVTVVSTDTFAANLFTVLTAPVVLPFTLLAAGPPGLLVAIPLLPISLALSPVIWIIYALNMKW